MASKRVWMVVLVVLGVLALAGWHVAAAKEKKAKKGTLPPSAAAAIKKAFPKATLKEVEREKKGVVLYEVELKQNGAELEVQVTAEGQIVEVEQEVARAELPQAVAAALAKLAGGAKVKEIEKKEVRAVVKLVELRRPEVVYEAEFVQDGKEVEVKISADGKLLGKEVESEDEENDD